MAKLILKKGQTSVRSYIFVQNSSVTTGAGLTGLVFNSAGLTAYYVRPGAVATAITLATQTVTGAYSSGGFVQIDATNMPGFYRFDIPDAVLATGVNSAAIVLMGATNMVPVPIEIQLTDVDLNSTAYADSISTIVRGQAQTGTLSTTQMTTNLTEATDDHYNGRIIIWTSGVLKDQATNITDYTGATKLFTYTATTEAPSNGDTFVIV